MKKIFLLSCAIVTSISAANQPSQKGAAKAQEGKVDYGFYAQCVQPNIDSFKKKFNENRPTMEKHAKTIHAFYTELSKTNEYALGKTCIGFALLTDLTVHRGNVRYRGDLGYLAQLIAGLYCTAPLTKQLYNDLLKRK